MHSYTLPTFKMYFHLFYEIKIKNNNAVPIFKRQFSFIPVLHTLKKYKEVKSNLLSMIVFFSISMKLIEIHDRFHYQQIIL